MIIVLFFIGALCGGWLTFLSYKFGYHNGYDDGWLKKDCEATKECQECVIRMIKEEEQSK
jgi:hypothetical protein